MERLSKKQAIAECRQLWKEIEESGLGKSKFLYETDRGKAWLKKDYQGNCPLCEYTNDCHTCPLMTKYGKECRELGFTVGSNSTEPRFFEAIRGL